jgi:hypothetical protein
MMFLFSCDEQKVSFRNAVPVVSIDSPVEGEHFDLGEAVLFRAQISDKQDAADTLVVEWKTSNAETAAEKLIDESMADATGLLFFNTSTLMQGGHEIFLTVSDAEGESTTARVNIIIGADEDTASPTGGDGAPIVSLDSPLDGAVVLQSSALNVVGLITDNEQDPYTLRANIVSSLDGGLWEGSPDEFGRVQLITTGLTVGMHTIRVEAIDDDANRGSAQVQIEVVEDARPGVVIVSPNYGDWFWNTDSVRFQGQVSDDVTDPQDLVLAWSSDVDGVFSTLAANPMGDTIVDVVLSAGFHTVTLAATDADMNETQFTIMVEVKDPLAHDGDLDGYTEYEGDCDDADPYTHPGAEEVCDDRDNDCDGDVNEDDWDDLEANNTLATATDLGRIDDGWLFSSGETESAGITLHSEDDEDWIRFDAGDDWGIDNVNIDISVGSFPHSGAYVVELYLLDESSTVPVDVDTGTGRLSVEFIGDVWDGGEDNFALRIYADTWPGGTCGRRFEVEIIDM